MVTRLCSVDVTEVFSPPRVTIEAKKFGLKAGEEWDLTNGWDFRIKVHRDAAEKYQEEMNPLCVDRKPTMHTV